MKRIIITLGVLCSGVMMAQVGHLIQGIGSVNMSMGGAATGQPIDISGALQWNPAELQILMETRFCKCWFIYV
jgi:long-chain fatty acid transport protein